MQLVFELLFQIVFEFVVLASAGRGVRADGGIAGADRAPDPGRAG
jgi:hypothetical protein